MIKNDDEKVNEYAEALAEYLDISVDDIEYNGEYYSHGMLEFDCGDLGTFAVGNEDESNDSAIEDVKDYFDEAGIGGFTDYARRVAITDYTDDLSAFVRDDTAEWVYDMEEGDLLEYAVDNGIFSESDLEDRDINDVRDDVIDAIYSEYESQLDYVDYMDSNYGKEETNRIIGNHLDLDAFAEWVVGEDGITHFLARYDGREIELSNYLYAYRID